MTHSTKSPVSYLQLEQFNLNELAPAEHQAVLASIAECPTSQARLAAIRADARLPSPLAIPLPLRTPQATATQLRPKFARVQLRDVFAYAGTLSAAAAVLLWMAIRTPRNVANEPGVFAGTKGSSALAIRVVAAEPAREGGVFVESDRFKVLFTCAQNTPIDLQLVVFEAGAAAVTFPIVRNLHCGNEVALPGAFELTGARPQQLCLRQIQPNTKQLVAPSSSAELESDLHACSELSPIK